MFIPVSQSARASAKLLAVQILAPLVVTAAYLQWASSRLVADINAAIDAGVEVARRNDLPSWSLVEGVGTALPVITLACLSYPIVKLALNPAVPRWLSVGCRFVLGAAWGAVALF